MVDAELQLSGVEDGILSRIEQLGGESNGVGHSDTELGVQLSDDRKANKRGKGDPSRHTLSSTAHLWKRMLR